MKGWALDLGTTNSGIACWNESAGQPQIIELPELCRDPETQDALEAPRMVPSAVHLIEQPGLVDRLGSWPPVARRMFLGRRALIGRPALEANRDTAHPSFVPTFKAALSSEATRPLARVGRRAVSAREVARAFLRELLAAVKARTGERIRDLVVTVPVDAFETYRAEVQSILGSLGVRRVRFVDEPVAAALGYGLSLSQERTVLVVDIGGGTMHVVLVRLSPRGTMAGEARVLAKEGRLLGGNAVDGWVLEEACRLAGYPPLDSQGDEQGRFWRRLMLAEACRVKEAVHFDETAVFRVVPPGFSTGPKGSSLQTFTRAAAVVAAGDERLLPGPRVLAGRHLRPGPAARGRGGRRAAGRRLDAAARRLPAARAALRAAPAARLAAVRGGGLRRRLLRRGARRARSTSSSTTTPSSPTTRAPASRSTR